MEQPSNRCLCLNLLEGAQRTSLFELAAREEACNLMRDLADLEIDARPRLEIRKSKSGV